MQRGVRLEILRIVSVLCVSEARGDGNVGVRVIEQIDGVAKAQTVHLQLHEHPGIRRTQHADRSASLANVLLESGGGVARVRSCTHASLDVTREPCDAVHRLST